MSTWESSQPGPIESHPQNPVIAFDTTQATAPPVEVTTATIEGSTAGDEQGADELTRLGEIPLADHPAIFERIHTDLQMALADIDRA